MSKYKRTIENVISELDRLMDKKCTCVNIDVLNYKCISCAAASAYTELLGTANNLINVIERDYPT